MWLAFMIFTLFLSDNTYLKYTTPSFSYSLFLLWFIPLNYKDAIPSLEKQN